MGLSNPLNCIGVCDACGQMCVPYDPKEICARCREFRGEERYFRRHVGGRDDHAQLKAFHEKGQEGMTPQQRVNYHRWLTGQRLRRV